MILADSKERIEGSFAGVDKTGISKLRVASIAWDLGTETDSLHTLMHKCATKWKTERLPIS